MRAFPRYVDAVTGEEVRHDEPGAVFSDVVVYYTEPGSSVYTDVPVPPEMLGTRTFEYAVKPAFSWSDVRKAGDAIKAKEREAKRVGKVRPTEKQSIPGVYETYRNAGTAATEFLNHQGELAGYTGAEDEIRGMMDGFEVRRGRQRKDGSYFHKKLEQTKKGQEILDAFRSSDYSGAHEFLTWIFSQNRGKRWDQVDWAAVDQLGDILSESCGELKSRSPGEHMDCSGFTWYPPGAGLHPLKERLEDLTPKAQAQVENKAYTKKLGELVAQLEKSYKKGKSCLPPQTRKTLEGRIRYLKKLGKEPWRIPGSTICGEDPKSGYQFCGFPAVEAEVGQLRKACEYGYDPNWPRARGLSEAGARAFGLPVGVATGEDRPIDVEGRPVTLEELEAIPWQTEENPGGKKPPSPGTLDDDGKRMLWTVYEAAKKHYRKQGERGAGLKQLASRVAWAEVKRHYFKRGKNWQKRKHVIPKDPQALDLRQRALPLKKRTTRASKANPPKYRAIKWATEETTRPLDKGFQRTFNHRGSGYRIHEIRLVGKGERWHALHRDSPPNARAIWPPEAKATQGGYWRSIADAKKAANADRRAYLKAKRKGGSKPKATSSKANPTRSRPTRNPWGDLLDLRARVVELEVETADGRVQVHTWNKDRPALFWSEKRRALVWVHGGKDPASFADALVVGPVAARHRKWHGADPSELGTVELPAGPLVKLGPALRIVYFAERYRDGKPRHHDFGASVAAYAQKSRGARVFEARGGRLTLNDRGLVF